MSHVRRRQFLIATGALLAARLGHAQQSKELYRIGWLTSRSPSDPGVFSPKSASDSLRRLGYEEGKNVHIEWRFAENRIERFPALASDLMRLNVDLIVTTSHEATRAAQQATRTIPIVMAGGSFPLQLGFIASYARPGGNITGLDWAPTIAVAGKGYQLLKEAVPGAKRIASLWDPNAMSAQLYGAEFIRKVSSDTGLSIERVELSKAEELAVALKRIAAMRADALYVGGYVGIRPHFGSIAAFALKRKMISISSGQGYAAAGGLLFYGAQISAMVARVASYIDRILRGAKPANLPVEQPTKYELVLNLKTARAMGLTLPPGLMVQVDRAIE